MHVTVKNVPSIYDLDLQCLRAMVMIYSSAKVQGQQSVGSEDKSGNKQTDGRTDRQTNERTEAIALPAAAMRSVTMNNAPVSQTLFRQLTLRCMQGA